MSKNTFGGINGTQVNKVGSVVGYKFRGEQVYRGYQKNVANPRTTSQVMFRERFGNLSEALRLFSVPVKMGFEKVAKGTKWSPRNYAYRVSYPQVFTAGSAVLNFEEFVLSRGNVINPAFGQLDFSTAGNIRVPVTSSPYGTTTNGLLKVVLVAYNIEEKEVCFGMSSLATDVQGLSANLSVPSSWSGRAVLVWAFVVADASDIEDPTYGLIEKLSASDSVYLGSGGVE